MNTKPAIIVDDVSKIFEITADRRGTLKERFVRGRAQRKSKFTALENISFEIPRGTTFGLIGHNGSGKSTMLKILAGVYRPTRGEVKVAGKVDALLELGAGFHGELTGRENIYLNGAILGRTKKEIRDSINWIIDFADIGDFIDAPVKVYSSGMTVRLGFASAVAVHPDILIVDEIIAVGDENFQRKCFAHLNELRRKGTTIALVTHSLALAQDLCDQAIWLDHGKLQKIGDAHDVVSAYLNNVNQQETIRGEANLTKTNNYSFRQGSGEARITQIDFLNAEGKVVPILHPGEAATVRMHITAQQELQNIEIGLAFIHESGTTIAGPNSRAQGRLYNLPAGNSSVDFSLNSLLLQQGVVWISSALVDGQHVYDYADREYTLTVREDSPVEQPGAVIFRGDWKDIHPINQE